MEKIDIPVLYFSHDRECLERNGVILAKSPYLSLQNGEKFKQMNIRYRTVGDMTCTGAVLSPATSVPDIIKEISVSRTTERGTRTDDKRSDTAMEDRKKQGYF
jgi:sulfate adenylyltransferase subunit 2